jgi:uncharacterized membrane protein (Fun14 family)
MTLVAKILSWVTLPLFTPMYALLIVFFVPAKSSSMKVLDTLYLYPWNAKALFLLLFLVFVVLAPGMSLIVLRVNRSISSLELPDQYERETPIMVMAFYTIVLYLFLWYQSDASPVPPLLLAMALGGVISTISAYFLNKSFKISLHGIGLGALVGFLYAYYLTLEEFNLPILLYAIVLAGLGLSARLVLKQHNLFQILMGFSLGFASQFFCVYFYV